MKAVKCPFCEGSGKVSPTLPIGTEMVPCHGCGGRGWVEVGESYPLCPTYPWPLFHPFYSTIHFTCNADAGEKTE